MTTIALSDGVVAAFYFVTERVGVIFIMCGGPDLLPGGLATGMES